MSSSIGIEVGKLREAFSKGIVDTYYGICCALADGTEDREVARLRDRHYRYTSAENACLQFLDGKVGFRDLQAELRGLRFYAVVSKLEEVKNLREEINAVTTKLEELKSLREEKEEEDVVEGLQVEEMMDV